MELLYHVFVRYRQFHRLADIPCEAPVDIKQQEIYKQLHVQFVDSIYYLDFECRIFFYENRPIKNFLR